MDLRLLPKAALKKTGPVDHADWNYHGLLGAIQRKRFALFLSLLPKGRIHRILELGYGSGVFLPELSRHCEELYGIDTHQNQLEISKVLSEYGVHAQLYSGTATKLPFGDGYFDCVAAISVLEFIADLETACKEIRRILNPQGLFIVVTPGQSLLLDTGLYVLTGKKAKNDFLHRGHPLERVLTSQFRIRRRISYPKLVPTQIRFYEAMALTPQHNGANENRDVRNSFVRNEQLVK